jgi:hypothetical protein
MERPFNDASQIVQNERADNDTPEKLGRNSDDLIKNTTSPDAFEGRNSDELVRNSMKNIIDREA